MYARYVGPDIDWYVEPVDEYVESVGIDCHCWNAADPIGCDEKGLYATDCWNWGGICEFDEDAKFVVTNASIANADADSDSTDDCCW